MRDIDAGQLVTSGHSWIAFVAISVLLAGSVTARAQEVLYVLPVQDGTGEDNGDASESGGSSSAERFLRPGADAADPAARPFWRQPRQRRPRLFDTGKRLFPPSRNTASDIGRDPDGAIRPRRPHPARNTAAPASEPAAPAGLPPASSAREGITAFSESGNPGDAGSRLTDSGEDASGTGAGSPRDPAGADTGAASGGRVTGNADSATATSASSATATDRPGAVSPLASTTALPVARPAADGISTGSIVDVNDRLRPDYEAPGARIGSLILRPSVGVRTEYTDNVTQAKKNRISDMRLRILPDLRLESNWSRHSLGLRLGGEVVRHLDNSTEDYVSLNAALTGRVDIRHDLSIDGEVSFSVDQEARDSADIAATAVDRPFYYTTLARLGVTKRFNRLSLDLRGTVTHTDYTDAELVGGGSSNNDDRDLSDYTVTLRSTYEFSPRLSAYAQGEYSRRVYDQRRDDTGVARGSYGLDAVAGATYEITRLLRGDVSIGYGARNYEDPGLKDIGYVNAAAAIYWNVRPHLTLRSAFTTSVDETTVAGASAALSRELVFGADMDVRRDLRIGGELRLTDRRYSGTSIRELDYDIKATAEYFVNRHVSVTAEIGHGGTKSNQAGSGYRENRISVGLNLKL